MAPPGKYAPELWERAVQMVFDLRDAGEGAGVNRPGFVRAAPTLPGSGCPHLR